MEATHVSIRSIRRARPLLGTFVEIAVAGASPDAIEAAVEAAFAAVATVHRLMSFHETDSDVSRLNRGAASGAVRVHDWTYQVLEAARDLHDRSGGMFDVSVAPALQRLGLLPGAPAISAPSGSGVIVRESGRSRNPQQFARNASPVPAGCPAFAGHDIKGMDFQSRSTRPTHDHIQLLRGHQVRFADPFVKIDLGGIAKGFAVDLAVEALRRHGVAEGLVNAGGDLRGFGAHSHAVDVRDPRHPDRPLCRVALHNAALASSAGRLDPAGSLNPRASAVIDPATATPARSIIGATVCAPCCMIADALTKVVMTAGEATAPILEHYGADALFVSVHDVVHMTANWKNEVRLAA